MASTRVGGPTCRAVIIASCDPGAGWSLCTKSAFGNVDQSVQDVEFELELDTVDQGLPRGLKVVQAGVLEGQDGDIEGNDDKIDNDEVDEKFADVLASEGCRVMHKCVRAIDIQSTDDDLLDEERGYLDALPDFVDGEVLVRLRGLRACEEGCGADLHYEEVENDHGEYPPVLTLVPGDQVKARIQDDTLTRDHTPAAKPDQENFERN